MRRLLGIVAIALAPCITPADTEAQALPTGVQDVCITPEFVGRDAGGGTSSPYKAVDAATRDTISPHNDLGNGMEAVVAYLHGRDSVDVQFTQRARCIERLTDWLRRQGLVVVRAGEEPPDPDPEEPEDPEEPGEEPEEPEEPEPGTLGPASDVEVTDGVLTFTPGEGAQFHRIDAPEGRFLEALIMPETTLSLPAGTDPRTVCVQARIDEDRAAACVPVESVSGEPVPPPPPPPPGPPAPPPAPPGQGWDPGGQLVCDEDFTRFADWAAFMSGARCISNKGSLDGGGRNNINVETSPLGFGSTGDGLWYRYREQSTRCGDQIVGQATIPLPNGTREVWMEFTTTFSANFDTENPGCQRPAPDFKYVLVWVPGGNNGVPCGNGRAEIKMGTNGSQIAASIPGFSQCDDVKVNPDGSLQTVRQPGARRYFDGQPHTYRVSFRSLGGSSWQVYVEIDGTVTHDYVTNSIQAVDFDRIMMGSNRNVGATEDMTLHWQSMKVWAR